MGVRVDYRNRRMYMMLWFESVNFGVVVVVCWLLNVKRPGNMLVYLRDGTVQTIVRAAALR